jgi:nitroreductase
MDLFEAIHRRHSYRGPMEAQSVPRQDLTRIVQAGIQAPSGYNAQTTTFVIVDDPDVLAQIRGVDPQNAVLQQARAVIAAVAPKGPEPDSSRLFFGVEDCAAAVENMLLAITALGYASVWLDGWLRYQGRDETVGRLLGVPEDRIVRVLLPLGVPSRQESQHPRKPLEERAWFNRHGG